MSPTILRQGNIRIVIYTHEGEHEAKEPLHVHVIIRGQGDIKLWLRDGAVEVARVKGKLNQRDISKALNVAKENYQLLENEWNEIHATEE